MLTFIYFFIANELVIFPENDSLFFTYQKGIVSVTFGIDISTFPYYSKYAASMVRRLRWRETRYEKTIKQAVKSHSGGRGSTTSSWSP